MPALTPSARKFTLTAHVTSSVGWLGAVAAFLALSVTGLSSAEPEKMRAAYLAMQLITWAVIVPLSGASLLTGIVQAVGTPWGLLRHYWVVAKLGIGVAASVLLVLHTQPIEAVAAVAAERVLSVADLRQLRLQLVADAIAAIVALLAATTLSVYKPVGLTPYGRSRAGVATRADRRWRTWIVGGILLVLLFAIFKHLADGGFSHH